MAEAVNHSVQTETIDNAMISGVAWSGDVITYTYTGLMEWLDSEKQAIEAAFSVYENVLDISFVEVASGGNMMMLFGQQQYMGEGILGEAFLPAPELGILAGNMAFAYDTTSWASGLNEGGLGFFTILHEIGHAMGQEHAPLFSILDDPLLTVMISFIGPEVKDNTGNAATLMPYDLLALQAVYGANNNYNSGDNIYQLDDNGVVITIWDTGGNDTYDATSDNTDNLIDLVEGGYNLVGNTISATAFGVIIENAIAGNGSDIITGNSVANNLQGNGGDDTLKGFGGNDTISAGSGNDFMNGNKGNDVIDAGDGNDKVLGGKNNDTVNGGSGSDTVNGNNDSDTVHGGAGDDIVHGGKSDDIIYGDAGNDKMFGDLGNDIIRGGEGIDMFVFYANSGADTIADFTSEVDKIQISSDVISSVEGVIASFSGGVINLGGGNFITLAGISSLTESDIEII